MITASVRCAPPANKPLREEIESCRPYLMREIQLLPKVRVIVALGRLAFDAAIDSLQEIGAASFPKRPRFGHGAEHRLNETLTLIASFHPSQQNTFTGKLTEPMFDAIFERARRLVGKTDH